ncbi:hypothetical protein GDO86_007518 [Hymenochirus boettgeri]|uniref:Uncharacterized protein n=1 Tax=Hymenochirus boettgeri TaxID=247094 RepID=A0A8T2IXR9_9PIPI|nr:hypothetical protein GDO86_007518 [Hymenochirus boettgeri]
MDRTQKESNFCILRLCLGHRTKSSVSFINTFFHFSYSYNRSWLKQHSSILVISRSDGSQKTYCHLNLLIHLEIRPTKTLKKFKECHLLPQ